MENVDTSPVTAPDHRLTKVVFNVVSIAVLVAGIATFTTGRTTLAIVCAVTYYVLTAASLIIWQRFTPTPTQSIDDTVPQKRKTLGDSLLEMVALVLRLALVTLIGTLVLPLWAAIVVALIVEVVFTTALVRRALRTHRNVTEDSDRRS